jgi:ribosomal protein L40E
MELAEGIRKVGFRRWYERQLIESHLHLVSWFLCLIMVMACLDGFSFRAPGWESLMRLAAMAGGGAIGIWSLARYLAMLNLATHAAERSICGKCAAYGLLEVTGARVLARRALVEQEVRLAPPALVVRCRKCGYEWTIE